MKIKFLFLIFFFIAPLHASLVWTSPPDTVSSTGVDSSSPKVVMHTNGDATAVWVEGGAIMARSKPSGGSWGTPTTLEASGGADPDLVIDSSGNVTAIWLASGSVLTATKPFGSGWGSSTSLAGSVATSPGIAVNADGDLQAIWAKSGNVETKTKLFGQSWPLPLDKITSTNAANPRVSMGGVGGNKSAFIVWEGTMGATQVIYAAETLIGGSWSAQQAISDTNHDARTPALATDTDGNTIAIWFRYDQSGSLFSDVILDTAYKPITLAWETPISVSQAGVRDPADLVTRVSVDPNGNAIAAWTNSFDGSVMNIQTAIRDINSGWGNIQHLVLGNPLALSMDLSINSFGNAYLNYMFFDGTNILIHATGLYVDTNLPPFFSGPIQISTATNNDTPQIAATLNGSTNNATAVWVNFDSANTIIQASTGTEAIVEPPTSPGVVQNSTDFGVFVEFFNTVTWTDSISSNIEVYRLLRDGIFIGSVAPGVQSFVDQNRVSGESVTYEIIAVNSEHFQSQPAQASLP